MSLFPNYKEILDLIKKGATVQAQEEVMKFREVALTLQEENIKLRETISALEAKLNEKEKLVWEPPFYWLKEGNAKDGPFCQQCYDSKTKLMRLQNTDKGAWRCSTCNNNFFETSYKPSGLGIGVVRPRSR